MDSVRQACPRDTQDSVDYFIHEIGGKRVSLSVAHDIKEVIVKIVAHFILNIVALRPIHHAAPRDDKAHRSFEACCKPAGNAIVIYGHSLADNDDHVLRAIVKGNAHYLLVSLYGNANSPANKAIIEKAEKLVLQRGPAKAKHQSLNVIYYDAASAKVWG
jgi:hypothetical protein